MGLSHTGVQIVFGLMLSDIPSLGHPSPEEENHLPSTFLHLIAYFDESGSSLPEHCLTIIAQLKGFPLRPTEEFSFFGGSLHTDIF